ncbi:MAG: right-handed parallel beta-helix repeat-containing protein [Planctomycetota bacterium]
MSVRLAVLLFLLTAAVQAAISMDPATITRVEPVSYERPDQVVGSGSPASVSLEQLQRAIDRGGVIAFDTGGQPITIPVTETLVVPVAQRGKPIVIDGGGLVTLDGLEQNRILQKEWKTELTVQNLRFVNGRTPEEGAGIYVVNWDGTLTVIDCHFENCKTTEPGRDIGGGAIRANGQRHLLVSGSTFIDCAGANGGAIGKIGGQMTVVGCHFEDNHAHGWGGWPPKGAPGGGGIGGAIYQDGCSQNAAEDRMAIVDCVFRNNRANDHAGAVFGFALDGHRDSQLIYYACVFEGNHVQPPEGKEVWCGHAGAVYSQNSHLLVQSCAFIDNRSPTIGGGLFTAKQASTTIRDCLFVGNQGGRACHVDQQAVVEGMQTSRGDVLPPERALGRSPGPQGAFKADQLAAAAAARDEERRREQVRAATAPWQPTSAASSAFKDLLRGRCAAALAEGRRIYFTYSLMRREVEMQGIDGEKARLATGETSMNMPFWPILKPIDAAALAQGLVTATRHPIDRVVAAFYLRCLGEHREAELQLSQVGEEAERLASAFIE